MQISYEKHHTVPLNNSNMKSVPTVRRKLWLDVKFMLGVIRDTFST